jgi:P-type Cu+ transporter
MANITFKVADMSCGHCEKRITSALSAIPGVQACKANSKSSLVELSLSPNTTLCAEDLAAIISEAGYTPQLVSAS